MKYLLTLLITATSFFSYAQSAATYLQNGKVKAAAKDYDGAIQEFTNAIQKLNREIELRPGTDKSKFNTLYSIIYNLRGNAKQKKLDYTGAMQDYNLAIALSPEDSEYWESSGSLKHELKDYAGAISDFNQAIYVNPPGSEKLQSLLALSKQQQALQTGNNPIAKSDNNFSQTDNTGRLISLSSFKGKYVLLNFWASWSAPSLLENKNVEAAYQKYKNKNLVVVGISLDKNREQWLNAIATCNPSWVQLSDLKGWNNELAKSYKVFSLPQIILLGPDGKIITDDLRGSYIESALKSMLK